MKTQKINEQTYLFEFQTPISEDEFVVASAQQSLSSPLAKKLFGFPWIESLKINQNSIELTKKDWVDWDVLLEPLQGLLDEHFSKTSVLEKSPTLPRASSSTGSDGVAKSGEREDSTEVISLRNFIQEAINPSLAMHGGFIELKSFENQTAYLSMGGGCQGCASSQATMFDGVETALKQNFSYVQRVIDVTDHAAGDNPYY
jgi:Fe-S cluster biogenesis protein NfuA